MTPLVIRDPVHGDVELSRDETHLLDAPEVQRLRGIKQTGTAHLVYPGCVHTRFDHSLGVLAAAKRILAALAQNGHAVPAEEAALVCAAALLHDVTHIPFGHTFEDERCIFPRHDSGHRFDYFYRGGELGRRLRALGWEQPLIDILRGRGSQPWMSELVAGCIDADLLDYLRRDSYFAGLSQNYDDRVYLSFILDQGHLAINLVKHQMDRADTRSEILHLLRMRYFLTERVYMHHAKIASGAMISKAVELARQSGLREEQLFHCSDWTLLELLASFPAAARLVRGVLERKLLKRAFVLSASGIGEKRRDELIAGYGTRTEEAARRRLELEEEIARRLGLEPDQVVVYCPVASLFKEAAMRVRSRHGSIPLNRLPEPEAEVQALVRQYEGLWRLFVFVPPEAAVEAGRICADILAAENEFTR